MTTLRYKKTVEPDAVVKPVLARQTQAVVQRRDLIIELHPGCYMNLRLKGKRKTYGISYVSIFEMAAAKEAARQRAEKLAARKAKKGKF